MLRQAASLQSMDAAELDKDLHQFNMRNGTLRFVKRENPDSDPENPTMGWYAEFTPEHRREDFNTKLADVDYDAAAICTRFRGFLDTTQPDQVMRLFVQVFHAYALLIGGNDEQKLVFHYGTGANGKSAFMEAIGRMAGTYRAVVSPDTITGDGQRDGSKANSDIARLHSARFVTVEELPRGVNLKEGLIKSLTGGTRQVARFLQKENFEFDPIFTAVMSGNDMPTVSGTDYGIWRRLLIVKWGVTIAEADRIPFGELMKVFDAERAGILNWLIEGALRYLNEGLPKFIPQAVTEFTEEYRTERDNVGVFAESHFIPMPGASLKAGEAFKAYTTWCEANGLRAASQRAFGDRLNAMGFKKKRGGYYVYLDIALVTVEPRGAAPQVDPEDPGFGT
jgi:putative DNA primase/helicase